jgi:hypothetical protein
MRSPSDKSMPFLTSKTYLSSDARMAPPAPEL